MKIHIVKKGDTLYKLSQKYHVDLQKLIEANPQIANPDVIDVGMKVKIPANAQPVKLPENMIAYKHVVKQGDSLWKLSKEWGVSLHTLIQANPQLKNPNVLLTGEVVYIPKIGAGAPLNQSLNEAPTAVQSNPGNNQPVNPVAEENVFEVNVELNKISIENPPETSYKVLKENLDPVGMGNPFMQAPVENAKKVEDLFAQYKVPATEVSGNMMNQEMPYLSAADSTNMNSPISLESSGLWSNSHTNVSATPPYMHDAYPYGCGQMGAYANLSMTQPYSPFADPYPGASNPVNAYTSAYSAPYGMPYRFLFNAPLNTSFGNAGFGSPYSFPMALGYSDPFATPYSPVGAVHRAIDGLANTGVTSGGVAQQTDGGEANIKQVEKKSTGTSKNGARKRQAARGHQRRAKLEKKPENLPWLNK
ncbi:LysM peptidoglycan-binding domain-containing protein [Ferviditalea candida]|uniref:LysM peptidoglycan-binding domain-containing protein n=1 Tax=Ferviditalea candida TaxID=3108399 RepID=A0ABU5ZLR8_9BACL|nr:LysM peptidoglycan-binding domain-containing protein [Paenibacillaceae bacterium T2]